MIELGYLALAGEKVGTVTTLIPHSITETTTEVYMLTQERLKELLHYNPKTGELIRKSNGSIATRDNHKGYLRIYIDGKNYLAHRVIWILAHGEIPNQIDHINGIKKDNRLRNLRNVSGNENQRNRKLNKRSKSGISGVQRHYKDNGYIIEISENAKRIYLGYEQDFFEACCVRKSAENRFGYHKNHGRITKPE